MRTASRRETAEANGLRMLTGWGRTAPSMARVISPRTSEGVLEALSYKALGSLDSATTSRVIPRGLGRSYGDAAQCAGGTVIDMVGFGSIGPLDPHTALVTVGGGVSLEDLIRHFLPTGWFVPVTPGTRQVTVGGAIAADIHGKNHHVDGSFCRHVMSITLATPGGVFIVDQSSDPELFWGTAGGMGLTGIVTEATLQMRPVETSWMVVDTTRLNNLDDVMAEMEQTDEKFRYSVAWVDCMASGRHMGRSVLTRGDHAPISALEPRQLARSHVPPQSARIAIPISAPKGLLNSATVSAFNAMWFHKAPRHEVGAVHPLGSFFHPLDGLADWNRLYGRRGFVQYQFVVGFDQSEVVREAVERISSTRAASFFAVLKRFGPGDPGPLSFPMAGWTLALDFPIGPPDLPPLLAGLDELVAAAGGRVYLAKDSRLDPKMIPRMYPRIRELDAVRRRVDPEGVMCSDLSRRLELEAGWKA